MKRLIQSKIQLKEELNLYDFNINDFALYEELNDDSQYILRIYNINNVRDIVKQSVITTDEPKRDVLIRLAPNSDYLQDKFFINYLVCNKVDYPKNCWSINQSASKRGIGYTMYILTMLSLPKGHYLISDRFQTSKNQPQSQRTDQVSTPAQNLWLRLFNDPDIYKKPIDNIEKPITPDKSDDGYTLHQLREPNDITTSDFLDHMYRVKDSVKSSYIAKIEQLKTNHDNFVNSLTKEILNEKTKNTISSMKSPKIDTITNKKIQPKIITVENDFNEIQKSILDSLERMSAKYFYVKYRRK